MGGQALRPGSAPPSLGGVKLVKLYFAHFALGTVSCLSRVGSVVQKSPVGIASAGQIPDFVRECEGLVLCLDHADARDTTPASRRMEGHHTRCNL